MGSVCASSMALQAAGVPVASPVAGVAMGLIKEGDDVIVLTDIAGVEDHLGDMDFKVAGSAEGINALQMDIKITGVTFEILKEALEQARQGRLFILDKMSGAISQPREELSDFAPRIESIKIDPEKIGAVIGKGGETIRGMQEEFEAEIDIDDDGVVRVYAPTGKQVKDCIQRINSMTKDAEIGDRFKGKVVKTTTFGAFIELTKGTDGLLHISNVKPGERVDTVESVLNSGDELDVTVAEVDRERGRIGLRLSDDPAIAGKTADEISALGSGGAGGGGGNRQRERLGGGERRGGRDRGGRGGNGRR
jgi:polyribonucleotide nucleotidyltransferase